MNAMGPAGLRLTKNPDNKTEAQKLAEEKWNKRTFSEMHRLSSNFLDQALNEGDGSYKP